MASSQVRDSPTPPRDTPRPFVRHTDSGPRVGAADATRVAQALSAPAVAVPGGSTIAAICSWAITMTLPSVSR